MLFIPSRHLSFPVGQFEMNERSWQARGLVAWYPMLRTGLRLHDLSTRDNHADLLSAASIEWSAQLGQPVLRSIINSGQASNGAQLPNIYGSTSTEATLMLYIRNNGNVSGAPVDYTTDFNVHHYPFNGGDNGSNCFCNALSAGRVNVTDWFPAKDQWHWYVVRTKNGAGNWQWWQDGRSIATQSGAANLPNVTTAGRRVLASNSSSTQGWGGFMAEARFYDRYLDSTEIIRLAKVPIERFELYKERPSRTWFIPPQITTVTMGALSNPVTLNAPSVRQTVTMGALSNPVTLNAPSANQQIPLDALSNPVTPFAPSVQQIIALNSLANTVSLFTPVVRQSVTLESLSLTPVLYPPTVAEIVLPFAPVALNKRTLKGNIISKRTLKAS